LQERPPLEQPALFHPSWTQHWLISPDKQPGGCTLTQKLRYDQDPAEGMRNEQSMKSIPNVADSSERDDD